MVDFLERPGDCGHVITVRYPRPYNMRRFCDACKSRLWSKLRNVNKTHLNQAISEYRRRPQITR